MPTSSTYKGWKQDRDNSKLSMIYNGTEQGFIDANGLHGLEYVVQSGIIDTTYDTDRFIWTAPFACIVTSVKAMQSAIEASSATTTLMVEKVASGTAISSGVDVLAAAANLKTGVTANTVGTLALNGTATNYTLAAGDSLALDFTNSITEYVGCLTITLEKLENERLGGFLKNRLFNKGRRCQNY